MEEREYKNEPKKRRRGLLTTREVAVATGRPRAAYVPERAMAKHLTTCPDRLGHPGGPVHCATQGIVTRFP